MSTIKRGKLPFRETCVACGKPIPNEKTLCATCAEDMGYPRRPR